MRHESGHYYWDRLVRDGDRLEAFRAIFGDERRDYGEALQEHYEQGPPADWQARFVIVYASAHPWEDWAEIVGPLPAHDRHGRDGRRVRRLDPAEAVERAVAALCAGRGGHAGIRRSTG